MAIFDFNAFGHVFMRKYAEDFHDAYRNHHSKSKFSPARLFLLTRSIELAAKSLRLWQGESPDDILQLRHDLEKVCDGAFLSRCGLTLSTSELEELRKANDYYENKGFEYFFFKVRGRSWGTSGPERAAMGWPGLPDESVLEEVLTRLLSPHYSLEFSYVRESTVSEASESDGTAIP